MKSNSLELAFLYCLGLAAGLGVLEVAVRRWRLSTIITRRVAHVAAGLFGLVMWATFTDSVFLACGALLLLLISISYYRSLLSSVHSISRKTYGEIFLPLGILVTALIAAGKSEIFVPAVLLMTLADAAAGVTGDLRAQQRPSKLGSLAFFAVAFIILLFYVQPLTAVTIAFITTVVERVSPYGSDNATIPVVAVILLGL